MVDENLLLRIKAGDQRAFRELYDNYKEKVYTTAYFVMSNKDVLEDSNKEVLYAVEVSTKDIYKYDGNIEKMELVYKNQLNNEKVTKKINEDLNGDGVKEEIKLDYYNEVLTVNDMSIAADIDKIKGISVVDINKKDARMVPS